MNSLDNLKQWLRDAYAMEEQSIQVLRRQAERNQNYPELGARIEQHIRETEKQAEQVKECLKLINEDTSSIKTGVGMVIGNIQAIAGTIAGDEIVKNVMFSYAHEHYEIGAYKVIAAAARHCGQQKIAEICETILKEEQDMQQWLSDHIDQVMQQYLTRSDSESDKAKR
jgi:ferritin-like metal-binding protein YciE